MPFMEFVKQPLIQGDCMFKKVIDICIARLRKRYCGLYPHQLVSAFDGQTSSLYYNDSDTQDTNCIGNWTWSHSIQATRINARFVLYAWFLSRSSVYTDCEFVQFDTIG